MRAACWRCGKAGCCLAPPSAWHFALSDTLSCLPQVLETLGVDPKCGLSQTQVAQVRTSSSGSTVCSSTSQCVTWTAAHIAAELCHLSQARSHYGRNELAPDEGAAASALSGSSCISDLCPVKQRRWTRAAAAATHRLLHQRDHHS